MGFRVGHTAKSTTTVTLVLLVTYLVMITSPVAKPMALAHRVGSGTLLGSADRVRRWSNGQDIPADKQVPCGRVTCDSRTQFCDDVVHTCESCEENVCNQTRFVFEGAKEDCQHYCPDYWDEQQVFEISTIEVTTPENEVTESLQSTARVLLVPLWASLAVIATAVIVITVCVVLRCKVRTAGGKKNPDAHENGVDAYEELEEEICGDEGEEGMTARIDTDLKTVKFQSGKAVCQPTDATI